MISGLLVVKLKSINPVTRKVSFIITLGGQISPCTTHFFWVWQSFQPRAQLCRDRSKPRHVCRQHLVLDGCPQTRDQIVRPPRSAQRLFFEKVTVCLCNCGHPRHRLGCRQISRKCVTPPGAGKTRKHCVHRLPVDPVLDHHELPGDN